MSEVEVTKDEILADFQACTGIEDVGVAIAQLEDSEWDLLSAVNKVVPQHTQTLPSERPVLPTPFHHSFRGLTRMEQDLSEQDVNHMEEDEVILVPPETNGRATSREDQIAIAAAMGLGLGEPFIEHAVASFPNKLEKMSKPPQLSRIAGSSGTSRVTMSTDFLSSGPSGSGEGSGSSKDIDFSISSASNLSKCLNVSLAECETLETLKTMIHSYFEIPPCQQQLTGWPKGETPPESATFGKLKLPSKVRLVLNTMSSSMDYTSAQNSSGGGSDANSEKFTLLIRDDTNNDDHVIEFPGSKTVRGVKEELYTVTEIPVRFQLWTGWPRGVVDSTTLSDCGLNKPHSLTIKKQVTASSSSTDVNKRHMELTDGSETSSDVEDLTESYPEEDFFVPEANPTPQKFLIPDNTPNEIEGTIQFSDNFFIRYGACHPMFFHGTLEAAVKEACFKPATQRKQLAIYLHHDGSVMSNVFCQQVLCNESIVSYLTNNYVVWGWDVTNESNRQQLLTAVSKNFGAPGVGTIRGIDRDRYPVIIIVSRVRSATEICSVVHGSVVGTVDELMGSLMHTCEMYNTQRSSDIREEEEREARERVKREQDEAYAASLQADRAKDEAKTAMEEQKRRDEMIKEEAAEQAQKLRDQKAKTLPPEPENDCKEPVCFLKCRLPGGRIISRKFLQSTRITVLFDYLYTQGFSKDDYRFLTTYPKRDLTGLAETSEMKDLFSSQDTLIVEQR